MSDYGTGASETDHIDLAVGSQYESMDPLMWRWNLYRQVSEPMDFYGEMWKLASETVNITEQDTLVDIGCFDGQLFLDAIRRNDIKAARLIGLDPYEEAFKFALSHLSIARIGEGEVRKNKSFVLANYPDNFDFVKANADSIPLADSSVKALSANFMLYLVPNLPRTLREIQRVIGLDGIVAISTNSQNNMARRHEIEHQIVSELSDDLGINIDMPKLPAQSFLSENAPGLLAQSGFEIIDDTTIVQQTKLGIAEYNLQDYIDAVGTAGKSLSIELPRKLWLQKVHEVTTRIVNMEIESYGIFVDKVDRQAFICRVVR